VPYAGGGRTLPCTRNFFEKKLSKSFIPAAAGDGCGAACASVLPRPPEGQRAGRRTAEVFE